MALNDRLRGVVDWLNAGYPSGIPPKDYIPLLALLRRRLTEDEVREIAADIAAAQDPTRTDIGVSITQITDACRARATWRGWRSTSTSTTAGHSTPADRSGPTGHPTRTAEGNASR